MQRKRRPERNNTQIAVFFFGFVFTVFLISAVLKFILIIRQSKFDDSSRFTLSVSNKRDFKLLSFSKNPNSMVILELNKNIKVSNIGKFLEIPIDASIKASFLKDTDSVQSLLLKSLYGFSDIKTNLTIIDLLRLYLFSKTVDLANISNKTISARADKTARDSIVSSLFQDPGITREKETIEIVNATDEYGLGNRLARLITNMGGNVVLVLSSQTQKPTSRIYYTGDRTYTVKRLEKVLGFKTLKTYTKEITDVIIEIGNDNKRQDKF